MPGGKSPQEGCRQSREESGAGEGSQKTGRRQKSSAKKAPAKKAPTKKAPAKKIAPLAPDTNGQLAAAAKEAAAHAKATVEAADNPLPAQSGPSSSGRSPLPFAVAIAISLLAILLIRKLRHDDD